MSTSSKTILTVAIAALIAAVAAVGSARMPAINTSAATADALTAGVSPFEIMLSADMQQLPVHEIKDGECSERC
jgi:hypothetical protein